jgi:diguanylate cyclase (GGDEF)-like protein
MPSAWNHDREEQTGTDLVRSELLTLRAALDDVAFGVVLLDAEMRAQFINRAYRKMWRLPDAKANAKPAFVALMYHGRDSRAYEIPDSQLDAYVVERVARVKAGDPMPIDVRLSSGEVIRFQCTVLPAGGRMLSYTYVTDIVRHSDELEVLRAALDNVEQGVILLDVNLTAQFMNRSVRRLWKVSDEQADGKPSYAELVNDTRSTHTYDVAADDLDDHISRRIALVLSGDSTPTDLRVSDGRIIRSQCTGLPSGGRMLTYTDVTDLARHAEELKRLATTDGMTGLYNRRHFVVLAEAEWTRFQRYHRPLSLMIVDIDHFKLINDRLGHDAGDRAIAHIATLCQSDRRATDVVARIGGDEFAVLLPETDLPQASFVAERLRQRVAESPLSVSGADTIMTVSIGAAEATLSMAGIDAIMKVSDEALYKAKALGRNRVICAGTKPAAGYRIAAE